MDLTCHHVKLPLNRIFGYFERVKMPMNLLEIGYLHRLCEYLRFARSTWTMGIFKS